MAATILDTNCELDKLTSEIFSILENKFLFGEYVNDPQLFSAKHQALPLEQLKSGKHITGKVRVLAIDGGGATDGVLSGKALVHLESCLREKSGDPNARIADFFDVVAGSGAGGVLAALLFTAGKDGRPIFTATEALNFVVENRRKIFRSPAAGGFRRFFRSPENVFGKRFGELTLKDTLKAVLIPCYDLTSGAPFVFSRADAFETDGYDFMIKDVCAATSAGHVAVEMKSIDRKTMITAIGGEIAMNNPTSAAITHVLNNKQEFPFCNGVEDLLVVSLGNGESCPGLVGKLSALPTAFVKIAGEGVSDMVDQAVSMAFGECRSSDYVRIQATNGVGSSKGDKNDKVLASIDQMLRQKSVESVLFKGKKLVQKTNLEKLELFSGELVQEHERRKTSILPTVVLKHASGGSPRTSSATSSSTLSSN
ncbi:patatin-like protein 7 [Daucus carota subsp. sativus]|uniref:patatin-like protein 7 n=1 Tax=Daucus carota subsp. sativus TaxID=79200 RepID=UPI0007B19949|nr:PREDICTED: patatin-like protein 7 [Daucus carota subsp. sativus]